MSRGAARLEHHRNTNRDIDCLSRSVLDGASSGVLLPGGVHYRTIYVLTIAATVLLVPTLMAGLWGMNFDYIPGTGSREGFWLALLILVIMAAGAAFAITWYLNRKPRLRSPSRDDKAGMS